MARVLGGKILDNFCVGTYPNTIPETVIEIPNKNTKQAIVELNNNFSPLDSQSLPLDIQFKSAKYTNSTKLIFTLKEMIETYEEQVDFREINMTLLRKGQALNLFELPPNLRNQIRI